MQDTIDPKDVEDIFDETIDIADDLHHDLVEAAQNIGYLRDVLRHSKDYWVTLAEKAQGTPTLTPIAASGVDFMRSYRDELAGLRQQTDIPFNRLSAAVGTAATFSAATSSTSSVITMVNIDQVPYEPCPFRIEASHPVYADRFAKLDPALGDTYRQIWESLYATRADRERSALYLMRQAFDHLFGHLAPDDGVRKSKHWQPKGGDKPNQIHRQERIEYAAHTHIKDPNRAKTLAASARQLLDLYNALNTAHAREALDPGEARKALFAMKQMLEEWAEALGL